MSQIKCIDLTKKYNITGEEAFYALNNVSLKIDAGEYIAVVGKSGSGKSTLMNMLGIIDSPTSGEVIINGRNILKLSENEKASFRNKNIGYIFQSFYLEPSYTAYKNVEMPLLIAGVDKKLRKEMVLKAMEDVGLSEKLKNRADELSGGEKQRVCIARALVNNPEIILADEPCGNLDSANTAEVMSLFDKFHSQGKTVVLITHSEEDARRSERQILMKDGKIVK